MHYSECAAQGRSQATAAAPPTAWPCRRTGAAPAHAAAQARTKGARLLWTIDQGLGPKFTPDVSEAWTAAYDLLATVKKMAGSATTEKGATGHPSQQAL